ncbi:aspartate/glutamate racemase family protein [Loktanella sp. SALINAS62]|uniref:aspartate/glutamate racemase family protein n=1 Tax=Loktanella sp. SALINAS62 TaxID=2706124 RepID=UPI001B8D9F13|nr:aspartate/glutamate racemase family protein [Loktanella sp. SALINAS62]MBS1300913.1 HyuE hydantoin racemase [Loktanella sp. SALINAS62]
MTVILINPNSTESMTQSALESARMTSPDIQFDGWTSTRGPATIEGAGDGALAIPPLLELVQRASESDANAIIIACFDDTGLAEAQRIARCPVIGIGQASYILASLLSGRTAVVTTVEAAIPVIKANIKSQGFGATIQEVVAAQVPVLTLAQDPASAIKRFHDRATALPSDTRNLILGCSAAVLIRQDLQDLVDFHVIDGVCAAARLCRVFAPRHRIAQ